MRVQGQRAIIYESYLEEQRLFIKVVKSLKARLSMALSSVLKNATL